MPGEITDSLIETRDRVDAVGNEHASEKTPETTTAGMADTGVGHILELLLDLDPLLAEELFHFASATAHAENAPGTNLLRGFLIGALWQREFGVRS
jgi:hypothetical protein